MVAVAWRGGPVAKSNCGVAYTLTGGTQFLSSFKQNEVRTELINTREEPEAKKQQKLFLRGVIIQERCSSSGGPSGPTLRCTRTLWTSVGICYWFRKCDADAARFRNTGNRLYLDGKYGEALVWYNRSICFAEKETDQLATGYGNRSVVYFEQGEQQIAAGRSKVPSPRMVINVDINLFLAKGIRDAEPLLTVIDFNLCYENCSHCGVKFRNSLIPCPGCVFFMYCGEECRQKSWNLFSTIFSCSMTIGLDQRAHHFLNLPTIPANIHTCDPNEHTAFESGRMKMVLLRPVPAGKPFVELFGPIWWSSIPEPRSPGMRCIWLLDNRGLPAATTLVQAVMRTVKSSKLSRPDINDSYDRGRSVLKQHASKSTQRWPLNCSSTPKSCSDRSRSRTEWSSGQAGNNRRCRCSRLIEREDPVWRELVHKGFFSALRNVLVKGTCRTFVGLLRVQDLSSPANAVDSARQLTHQLHYSEAAPHPQLTTKQVLTRIMSGTLHAGQEVRVLGENYSFVDEKDSCSLQVGLLWIYEARYKVELNRVQAGNWDIIAWNRPVKSSTTCHRCQHERGRVYLPAAQSILIAIEPVNPSKHPKIMDGLRKVNKSCPLLSTLMEEFSVHEIICTGEHHSTWTTRCTTCARCTPRSADGRSGSGLLRECHRDEFAQVFRRHSQQKQQNYLPDQLRLGSGHGTIDLGLQTKPCSVPSKTPSNKDSRGARAKDHSTRNPILNVLFKILDQFIAHQELFNREVQDPAGCVSFVYTVLARRCGHVTQDAPVHGSSLYIIKDFIRVAAEGSSARSTSQRNSLRDILQLIARTDTRRDLINDICK
ncbi:conserved hypothetical protein [Culex quinquefasciatus]|uniref:MYND-type domain-containing protein n=1 Tax=Culex quinquefasciatus TaxID=7176 RepID=B0WJZ6_CULQU|nr:conserved hypothetical protein [Culex quinquefasciatus]|eukprot:XP_001849030.1 conserved hypothetical protein [Culex quinquefasciatus]